MRPSPSLVVLFVSTLVLCGTAFSNATTVDDSGVDGVDDAAGNEMVSTNVYVLGELWDHDKGVVSFPLRKEVTVLCGVVNNGHYPVQVQDIGGRVSSRQDASLVMETFEPKLVGVVIQPNDEFTFAYSATSREDREGVEATLVLEASYVVLSGSRDGEDVDVPAAKVATLLNASVMFVELGVEVTMDMIVTYLIVVAIVLVTIVLFRIFAPWSQQHPGRAPTRYTVVQSGDWDDGYNDPTKSHGGSRRRSSRS